MDLKTQRRIAKFKQKEREKRSMQKEPLTAAEKERKKRLALAKKRRPGFGSSVNSVADHLNEVVGLTEKKLSKKEIRDQRIESAAKRGYGCRRFEVAAAESGASKFHGKGHSLTARSSGSSGSTTTTRNRTPVAISALGGSRNNTQNVRDARAAFLARLEQNKEE